MRLSAKQTKHLRAVAAYQERYVGHRMYAGRDGTSDAVLVSLCDLGLLSRRRDENGLRWWYGLTAAGAEKVEAAA